MRRNLSVSIIAIALIIPQGIIAKTLTVEEEVFSRGYIITSIDTLKVFIKEQPSYDYKIHYKVALDSEHSLTISPKRVLSISSEKWTYRRINIDGKSIIAEVLESGHITLFKHIEISYSTNHVYDSKKGMFLPTRGYAESINFYLKKEDTFYTLGEITGYKRNLKKLLNEQPQLQLLIKKLRYRYLQYELDKVIRKYNSLMEYSRTTDLIT